jgi:phage protein D/phage baseplate assembly protein gpV
MPDLISEFTVKIGGSAVSQDFMRDVLEIVVDSSLHIPSMFTIQLRDPTFNWVENTGLLDIGKKVEIEAKTGAGIGGRSEELTGTLIEGEITALEPHFSGGGRTSLVVRGYDKSHRLHRGKKTRTFLSQKDSALVSSPISGEAELTAEVDATTVTHDYILQNNQTDMEFLLARAQRIGYQVFAADGKLYFKKGDFCLGDGATLTLGDDLLSFQPCYSATHQADKMIVKGWDPKGKAAIASSEKTPVSSLNQGGMSETGGATSESAFGSAEAVVTDRPVFTVDEANEIATGLSNDISREFVEAEGACFGHPAVKAGWKVDIQGVGSRFGGQYFVTLATHIWSERGYETRFSISGRQPNTLSHLLDSGNGHGRSQGLVHGVVPAQVTNLDDPDNLGRVKVKYTWLGEIESDWVRIATPMAGAERGFLFLPEVDDEVLVAFEHGDVHHPYMVGGLWSSTDKPPEPNSAAVADGKVVQRVIKTRSGHIIILDDTQGSEQIIIRDKTEANEIAINSKDNSMTIKCDGDLTIEAGGKFTVTSTGDMSLTSKANGKIETTQKLDIEATGAMNVKATQSVTVEGTAGATVKNAAAEVALSGPTVNINKGALEVT